MIMKKIIIIVAWTILMFPVSAFSACIGDINNNGSIDLQDAIVPLQVLSGMGLSINASNDINGDGKIGVAEAVYILQVLANLRSVICFGTWDSAIWDSDLWGG
jgi:hypothetical protein